MPSWRRSIPSPVERARSKCCAFITRYTAYDLAHIRRVDDVDAEEYPTRADSQLARSSIISRISCSKSSCGSGLAAARCPSPSQRHQMERQSRGQRSLFLVVDWRQGRRVRYPLFLLRHLERFMKDLVLHRFLAEQSLEFAVLLLHRSIFRGRNDFFARADRRKGTLGSQASPLEQLIWARCRAGEQRPKPTCRADRSRSRCGLSRSPTSGGGVRPT